MAATMEAAAMAKAHQGLRDAAASLAAVPVAAAVVAVAAAVVAVAQVTVARLLTCACLCGTKLQSVAPR
jgi:hypothetical protein